MENVNKVENPALNAEPKDNPDPEKITGKEKMNKTLRKQLKRKK